MTERTYALSPDCGEKFYNQADYCIGTGRMGLALHKEYYDQLKLVQSCPASYIFPTYKA